MASRPLKLIDATTLATSPLVRYPLTGGKVIQGKTRHPSSRAADTFRERETARLKRALQSVTHGRHIFAYNHIRTNQVVYSLSRTLQVRPPSSTPLFFFFFFCQTNCLDSVSPV